LSNAAKTETTPNGIRFTFPRLRDKNSIDLKDDLVGFHQSKGRRLAYMGDGLWELQSSSMKLLDEIAPLPLISCPGKGSNSTG